MAKWQRQIEFGFSSFRASSFLTIHLSTIANMPEVPYYAATPGLGRFEIADRRLADPAMSEEESWTKAEEYALGELVAYWADQMRALCEAVGEAAEAVRMLGEESDAAAGEVRGLRALVENVPVAPATLPCPECGAAPRVEQVSNKGCSNRWAVACPTLRHLCSGWGFTRDQAIEHWNEDVGLRL